MFLCVMFVHKFDGHLFTTLYDLKEGSYMNFERKKKRKHFHTSLPPSLSPDDPANQGPHTPGT